MKTGYIKKILILFAGLLFLNSCDVFPSSADDASESDGSNKSYAKIVIKNKSTKRLVKVKIGYSTYTVNLGYGESSATLSLPVDDGSSKKISATWAGFDALTIKKYSFSGGEKYLLTFYATPYAPLHGSIYLKNVVCSIAKE